MVLTLAVSFILPPFLVHHMPPAEYSAWVLILQLSAYVNYLELGMQTAIGKYVAEFHATGDKDSIAGVVGTAFTILSTAAGLGLAAIGVIAWRVPQLFHQMPADLTHEVRLGVLAVGSSTAILLPFSVFLASFLGLQSYLVPGVLMSIGKVVNTIGVILLLLLHGSIAQMALLIAAVNILTAAGQYFCWHRYARADVPFNYFSFNRRFAYRLAEYCGVLSLWMIGGLFISGLDTTIVGHFDYKNTGYYAVAGSATNFMLLIVGNLLGPLMPALSSLQTSRSPGDMGVLLIRITRYGVLLLCALGLPLMVGSYPILSLWLGRNYAAHSMQFLIVLVAGNMIRQFGYPYALMVVATGNQRLATIAPVSEAIINFSLSVWLAHRMGAIGVAYGTVLGSLAGLFAHIAFSMHFTQATISLQRTRLLIEGFGRPLLCILPTLLLIPAWHGAQILPMKIPFLALWAVTTAGIAWTVGVNRDERHQALSRIRRLV
jgi:O-antigen/teichoic acid export membrane protein